MKAAPCPFRNVGVVSQKICPRSSTVRGMSGGYCGWADLQKSKISVHTVWLGVLSWKCSVPELETKLKDVDLRFSQHVVVCAPLSCCFSNEISRRCWASVKSHWLEEDTDSVAVRCNFLWMRASAKWLKYKHHCFLVAALYFIMSCWQNQRPFSDHYLSLPTEAVTALHLPFLLPETLHFISFYLSPLLHSPTPCHSALSLDWYLGWKWHFIKNEI